MNPIKLVNQGYVRGAHHPHCERHAHHLIWLRGRPLCLGCFCLGIGVAIGTVTSPILPWERSPLALWIAIHLALIAPTALQPYIQRKGYKVVARTLLGAGTISYAISGMLWISPPPPIPQWLLHITVPLALLIGYKLLTYQRLKRFDDPCINCPLGIYPTCSWNLPMLLSQDPILGQIPIEQIDSIEHFDSTLINDE